MDYYGVHINGEYLVHYGRLGMKWGQHIFGDDPRWGIRSRGKGNFAVAKAKRGGQYNSSYEDEMASIASRESESKWSAEKERARQRYFTKIDKKNTLSKLKKDTKRYSTFDEFMKSINPKYATEGSGKGGYRENCGKCAIAFDLKTRGYDARAYGMEDNVGHTFIELFQAYKNVPHNNILTADSLTSDQMRRALSNAPFPSGSSGILELRSNKYGYGHYINFVVFEDGDTQLYDAQVGRYGESIADDYSKMFDELIYFRTDNAEFREDGVGRFVDPECFKEKK